MSTHLVTFAGYNPGGGLLPGLSPAWTSYTNAVTGASGSAPSITALGSAGLYQVTVDDNYCGMIQLGGIANPIYVFVTSYNVPTFGVFDSSGNPLPGLVLSSALTWDSIIDTSTGIPPSLSPTFTDLGDGCYKPTTWVSTYCGVLDGGPTANPSQQVIGPTFGTAASSAIIISAPTPASSTTISNSASIQFTVTDANALSFSDCSVEIVVKYPSGAVELAYSTTYGGFTPLYAQGSDAPPLTASLTSPGGFIVTRSGGWPAAPTMLVSVSDTTGQAAEASWFWSIATAPISAVTSQPPGQTSSPYGSDCRTFAVLADGTIGVDPYFLLVSDPQIVMTEAIARLLSMPQGALWYATSLGYDLLNLVNIPTNGDLSGYQSAMAQAVSRDPRIASCSCFIAPIGNTNTYSVNINGIGKMGPFSCVFLLAGSGITALSFT